jgi:hypothetical protein
MAMRVLTAGRSRMTAARSGRRRAAASLFVAVAAGVSVLLVLAGGGLWPAAAAAEAAGKVVTRWGRAEPVPGLVALNKGYNASVNSLSCWAAGDCIAGGMYTDKYRHAQAFVALERKGRWGSAIQVPGTAVLNAGGNAQVGSVSCARTGACVAVGTYTDLQMNTQWFTAVERAGRWRKAAPVPVPGLTGASISTVWCAPGGLCAAGGSFTDATGTGQAWVMTQTAGRWHAALEVPGIAALNVPGGSAQLSAVSCSSAGNCGAGGIYVFGSNPAGVPYGQAFSAFVVTETNGVWGDAEQVPGIMPLNPGMYGGVDMISCPAAGNCTAAGYDNAYWPSCSYPCQGTFVVSERDGIWGTALNPGLTDNYVLTCVSAGDCVDGGDWLESEEAGVVSETNGTWGGVVGLDGAHAPYGPDVVSVSCSSVGYCVAGGVNSANMAFVATEQHGTWGKAITPAGIPSSDYTSASGRGAQASAVACPSGMSLCVAGGFYEGRKGGFQAFVVSQVQYRVR